MIIVLATWKRNLISFFIIFNILAILIGASKPESQLNPIQKFFNPYLVWTRLLQQWKLFVPDPRTAMVKYSVDITFKDGRMITWQRPYPPNWDFFERHLAYNFQKWDLATDYIEEKGLLWPDLAHFIEYRFRDEKNPPEIITFIRTKAKIPDPNPIGYVMHDPSEFEWGRFIVFTYHVSTGKFDE